MTTGQKAFKRRLANLIEISNEMALSAADSQFSRGALTGKPGKIHYVFDETAFEAFFRPDERRRKYPAYFHIEDWRGDTNRDERYWILINEMLTIIAAEFMFFGKLPGIEQGDCEPIYMTYWHHRELGLSASAIYASVSDDLRRNPHRRRDERDAARKQLENALAGKPVEPSDNLDRKLQSDLRSVKAQLQGSGNGSAAGTSDQVPNFLKARRLARVISHNKEVLISDQLRRLSESIVPRLRSLNEKFSFESAAEEAAVESEARQWRERFSARLKATRGDRHDRGLRRDSLSLALVQHIARNRLSNTERIVLVTGDKVMLEAYWSWYAERYVKAPWEPHVVRSVGRFSPIMNFSDMLTPEAQMRAPFELMQVALTLAISPFNMSGYQSLGREDRQKVANLSYLRDRVLQSIDNPEALPATIFTNLQQNGKLGDLIRLFAEVRDKCQELERNSFRVGLRFLEQRAEEVLKFERDIECLESPINADDEGAKSAMQYFRRTLTNIVVHNVRLWLPIVQSSLKRPRRNVEGAFRAPITLRLLVPPSKDGSQVELLEFEKQLRRKAGDDEIARLEKAPHLVFALGILFALRSGLWLDAHRYAEFAKVAYRHVVWQSEAEARNQDEYQELRYLRAVCARLMIGAADPTSANSEDIDHDQTGSGEDVWYTYLNIALNNLNSCAAFHEGKGQVVRALRAISERASARFFYSAWAIFADGDLAGYEPAKGVEQFDKGVDDLSDAYDRASSHKLASDASPEQRAMLDSVHRQMYVNIAAADTIRRRSRKFSSLKLDSLVNRAKRSVGRWIEAASGEELPLPVLMEVTLFAKENGFNVAGLRPASGDQKLPLDRALVAFLSRESGENTGTPYLFPTT